MSTPNPARQLRVIVEALDAGPTPAACVSILLSPAQAEDLYFFNKNFPRPAGSSSQAYRLVDAVVAVYSQVRDGWLAGQIWDIAVETDRTLDEALNKIKHATPTSTPTEYVEARWTTPSGVVRLRSLPSIHKAVFERLAVLGLWQELFPSEGFPEIKSVTTAAEVVLAWASDPTRTPAELSLAYDYLSRWPEGPQLPNLNGRPIRVEVPGGAVHITLGRSKLDPITAERLYAAGCRYTVVGRDSTIQAVTTVYSEAARLVGTRYLRVYNLEDYLHMDPARFNAQVWGIPTEPESPLPHTPVPMPALDFTPGVTLLTHDSARGLIRHGFHFARVDSTYHILGAYDTVARAEHGYGGPDVAVIDLDLYSTVRATATKE